MVAERGGPKDKPGRLVDEAHVGVLYPASGLADTELQIMAPSGMWFHTTRISMPSATRKNLERLRDEADKGAELLAEARVDLVVLDCTLGSLIGGPGYDEEISRHLEGLCGIPATTASTALRAAIERLGLKKVVLITPYLQVMNDVEKEFLASEGCEVIADSGFGLITPFDQAAITEEKWVETVLGMEDPDADGYIISCGGVRVSGIIEELERELDRPVISSQQVVVWYAAKLLGFPLSGTGFGRLLEG